MRQIQLNPKIERLSEMTSAYGLFDLDQNSARPTPQWEHRNLHSLRLPFALQSSFFPDFWIKRVLVNRRAAGALSSVLAELAATHTIEALHKTGLDRFTRCYAFGDSQPSLFWFGAAWELSPIVSGEALTTAIKTFSRHGWTYCGIDNRSRTREFEFW